MKHQHLARIAAAVAVAASANGHALQAADATRSWRFDFASGPALPGWTQVAPETTYSAERGFGFDLGSKVEAVNRGGNDPLRDAFVTAAKPFYFSVALPEGNYEVAVTFGDRLAGSTNTVKAESRRLMLERVVTKPGEFVTRLFTVNIRTPAIPGGSPVRLKDREQGALHWDDKLTLELNGARPALCAVEIKPAPKATTVYLLGDSTVTDQPSEPWNSWGQMLPRFFEPGVAVANHAESGESLRSSLNARRVEKVLRSLQSGDYVLIQFGHNDQKDKSADALANFQKSLTQLVAAVRARGAAPVLIASMERKAGARNPTLGDYPDAVRAVARDEGVPFINLQRMSQALYVAFGPDLDRAFVDGTHHNAYGSYELARCVVEGLRQNNLPLAQMLTDDLPMFDPRKPDPVNGFSVPASPQVSETKPEGN